MTSCEAKTHNFLYGGKCEQIVCIILSLIKPSSVALLCLDVVNLLQKFRLLVPSEGLNMGPRVQEVEV